VYGKWEKRDAVLPVCRGRMLIAVGIALGSDRTEIPRFIHMIYAVYFVARRQ
jgi:hypothetical protein